MQNNKTLLGALIFSVALVLSIGAGADTSVQEFGSTLTIDNRGGADYTSIRAAIDAAHTGDIIEVNAGTYSESVRVDKTLKLVGVIRDGSAPVINADGFNHAITIAADGCTIEGFRIIGADGAGITISSDNNIINGNVIFGNNIGIEATGSGNRIFNNYLDNARNAEDSGSNCWNASMEEGVNIVGNPYLGGNYWSDYTGEDINGDGIGDIPYQGDALPLVLSPATAIDTFTHSSNPPPEEVAPMPYEVEVGEKEVETRFPRQKIPQQEKIIDEPAVIVTAPPSSMSEDERILVEQLKAAKTAGNMEKAIRIEEELAKIKNQPLEYVAPAPVSEGEGRPQGGLVSPEESEIRVMWIGDDILVAGTNSSEVRPSMASDKDGNLYVAVEYADPDSSLIRIYKSTNNGSSWYFWYWFTWGPDQTHPSLTIAEGNENWLLMAVNHDNKDIGVWRVNLTTLAWELKVVEAYPAGVSYPRIVTDSSEYPGWYAYIVYNAMGPDNWVLRFSRSYDFGANWTTPVNLWGYRKEGAMYHAYPDIDYGSHNLYVAFDDHLPPSGDDRDIYVKNSSNFGGSWSSEVRLTTSSDDEYDPAVAAVKKDTTNKTAVVAYTRYYNSQDLDVRYAYTRNGGATWYTNYWLAYTSDNEKSPDLTTSFNRGSIHAAYWHDYDIDYAFADYLTPYWWTKVNRINSLNYASSAYSRPSIVTNPQKSISAEAGVTWTDFRNSGMTGYDIYFDSPATCTVPTDDLYINGSTTLCPGVYNIPDAGATGVIIINADDVVLDCNGATIIGSGSGYGIWNDGHDNVTIKNCVLRNYYNGITLINWANDNVVSNNEIYENQDGIHLLWISKNSISDNKIHGNSGYGIWLRSTSESYIWDNICEDNEDGIRLTGSTDNWLYYNVISDNAEYGLYFTSDSTGNSVYSNIVCHNKIDIYDGDTNSGDYNSCNTTFNWNDTGTTGCTYMCPCYDYDTSSWVFPNSTGDWNIEHHIVCNCTYIKLNGDLNINGTLEFNNVYLRMNCTDNGEYGINVNNGGAFYVSDLNGAPSTITNGDVSNAYHTFRVNKGSKFKLLGSRVYNAGYAWNLDTAGDNYNNAGLWINTDKTVIDRSTIANNHFVGVIFYESSSHKVTNSEIHSNDWDGIYAISSSGNYFYNNSIHSNKDDGVVGTSCPKNYFESNQIHSNKDDGIVLSSSDDARIIDCNVSSNSDDGIVLSSSDNARITNCAINSNGYGGIVASASDNLEITDNTLSGNDIQDEGITISSSNNCNINDNNLDKNRWFGIHLASDSQYNMLRHNTVTYSDEEAGSAGVYISQSPNNTVTEKNKINSNLQGILAWQSSNTTVSENIANSNSGTGIALQNSDKSLVTDNDAHKNGVGIGLSSTDDTNITSNRATENLKGIGLSSSNSNNITKKNYVRDNDFGISLMWSSNNNIIEDNDIKSNHNYGIYLFKSNDNGIYVNDMDNSDSIGVYLEESHDNEIIENTARSSGSYGIDLFNSDRNDIVDNNVTESTNIGIELSSSDFTEIINNTAEGSNRGISLRWSSANNLTDNDANENAIGIYMFQSHRNNVSDNEVNDNGNNGLELSISNDNTIINNSACNNPNYGVHAYSSKRNSIESNIADYNGLGIYLDWSEKNDILNNTANNNDINGITLDWSSNDNEVLNNDAKSNGNISIQVSHSCSNLVQENTATGSAIGIFMDWSPDNRIIHNDVSNNLYHGITLEWFSDRNEISENDAYGNIVGISLQRSSENVIGGNNASDNNVSINLEWSSDNNLIRSNQANNNQYYGISLSWSCNDNEIVGNAANNSKKGLHFDEHSTGNAVNNNIFCGNSEYDIDDDDSNTGDDNRCTLTDNWNDIGTVGCTYVCQQYDHIKILPEGPLTMIAGETQEFTAYACDAGDNIIETVSVNWNVVGGIGTVNPTSGTSTIFTAINAGTGYVHADDGKGHTDDVEILVVEAPIPDVTACDVNGTAKNFFRATDGVYCYGYTLAANKDVDIYIVNDGNWSAGDAIPGDVSGGKETVTTNANGTIPITLIWMADITVGQYDIIVDVNQNGYVDGNEPIDDNLEVGFEVVPTVISTGASGAEKNAYTSGDNVYAKATDLAPDTTYTIWIQPEPVLEGEMLDVSKDPSGSQEVVNTDSSGNLSNTLIWSNVPPGPPWDVKYDIVVDRTGDGEGIYSSAQDGLDDIESWGFAAPAFVPAKPDLVITEKWVNWPECHEPGINCTICYNVTNIGNGTASAGHNTTLYVDSVEVARDYVSEELAPGENYTGCFDDYNWTYTSPGDNITVCADNNETVDESNETNNCLTNIWKCGDVAPYPDCNEKVDMGDVILLLNNVSYPGNPRYLLCNEWAGDCRCSGKIDMGDVILLLNNVSYPGNPRYALDCCC
jgi:parallel beta-helix repeat protein